MIQEVPASLPGGPVRKEPGKSRKKQKEVKKERKGLEKQ
jgi:hypothetical protein